ncbi:MAG: flagellar hook-associated protein 2 [Candidatus Paceibacteria bacterium]|jgi:flagellar hook-associated protein 2
MISFGGLGSGLDTGAIIQALVNVERVPINLLGQQKQTQQAKFDLIGTFKGLVDSLKTAAGELRSNDKFYDFAVTSSSETAATIIAGATAESGSHTLTVNSLAQADRWAFDGVLDPSTNLASVDGEQVDFTVNGTSYSIALTAADSSLANISSQINSLAGDDVTSSVVNVGTESAPSYQLVIAGDSTGEDNRITGISSTVTGLTIDGTGPDGAGAAQSSNNITVGSNAVAIIDGLTVERATNSFGDVITGVDITVQTAELNTEVTFTVAADKEAVKAKIQTFVDAYNEVVTFTNDQNTFTEDDGAGGELFGDSVLRSVRSSINSALFNVSTADVMADTEGYSTLSLVGIKTENDGTLLIDDTVFDDKFATNIALVADLFVDSDGFDNGGAVEGTADYYVDTTADSGLADKLYRALDLMTGSIPDGNGKSIIGILDSRSTSLQERIDSIQDTIDDKERYLEIFEATQVSRFAALEKLMGSLNAQGAALQGGLAGLQGLY